MLSLSFLMRVSSFLLHHLVSANMKKGPFGKLRGGKNPMSKYFIIHFVLLGHIKGQSSKKKATHIAN